MHSIKSKARRLAWRPEDGGVYNPFGPNPLARTTSKHTNHGRPDHQRTQSEPMVPSNIQTDVQDGGDEPQHISPIHGHTMGPRIPTETREVPSPTDEPESRTTTDYSKGTQATNSTVTSKKQLLRQRIRHFGKHEEREPDSTDLEKQPTSKSKKSEPNFTLWGTLKATIFRSWINVLLVCVPVGIAIHFVKSVNGVVVFVINFLAIIPLAGLLSYATEEIAMRTGETLGGLLNASFGNAVELIVSILALVDNQVIIVKTSLIGSMLSNLLLVMGMCFFFGGLKRIEQFFNVTVAQTAASLLALAVGSIIIPTVFRDWSSPSDSPAQQRQRREQTTPLSRGVAVILLVIYACYLLFQLKTHVTMYNEKSAKASPRKSNKVEEVGIKKGIASIGAGTGAAVGRSGDQDLVQDSEASEDDDDEEVPEISLISAIVTLCVATAFVGWTAEYMVDGISSVTKDGGVSPEFVGLILIPIVGNAAEHATALTVAIKDKMDLAIGVAIGSSLQIALLVLPISVIVGWGLGNEQMNLSFDGFLVAVLFVAVLLVNYLIGDGRSHWMEGVLLMALYIIIAVAAWFYPADTSVVG